MASGIDIIDVGQNMSIGGLTSIQYEWNSIHKKKWTSFSFFFFINTEYTPYCPSRGSNTTYPI